MLYFNSQKGVSLYLALAFLAVLLAIALGVATIIFGQLQLLKTIGFSTISLYAADSGIERDLYEKNYSTQGAGFTYAGFIDMNGNGGGATTCPIGLQDKEDVCYQVTLVQTGPVILRSVGYYKEVSRALEITF